MTLERDLAIADMASAVESLWQCHDRGEVGLDKVTAAQYEVDGWLRVWAAEHGMTPHTAHDLEDVLGALREANRNRLLAQMNSPDPKCPTCSADETETASG